MGRPGWNLERALKATSRQVLAATNNRQRPWQLVSLQGDFIFKAKEAPAVKRVPAAEKAAQPDLRLQVELTYWNSVKDSSDPAAVQSYLQRYPNGNFVPLAKSRLAALQARSQQAALAAERQAQK